MNDAGAKFILIVFLLLVSASIILAANGANDSVNGSVNETFNETPELEQLLTNATSEELDIGTGNDTLIDAGNQTTPKQDENDSTEFAYTQPNESVELNN